MTIKITQNHLDVLGAMLHEKVDNLFDENNENYLDRNLSDIKYLQVSVVSDDYENDYSIDINEAISYKKGKELAKDLGLVSE